MLLDQHEPNGLVEPTRWVVLGDAQTEGTATLGDARLDQIGEKTSSNTGMPVRVDDCDGQFGHILSNEAVAPVRLRVGPIPGGADRFVAFGNESVIAMPRPSIQVQRVPRIGHRLLPGRSRLVRAPDGGFPEHRRQKREVLDPGWSNA